MKSAQFTSLMGANKFIESLEKSGKIGISLDILPSGMLEVSWGEPKA